MAQKSFQINQKCKLNGQTVYASGRVLCEDTEIDALVTGLKLEGEVTVMEEKTKSGNADTNVVAYNLLGSISMSDGTDRRAGIYPSKRGFVVANTLTPDEVVTACKLIHPFPSDATKKPERVYSRLSGGDVNQTASE